MTIGFFSPLPPARTGVAGYSQALLEAFGRLGAVKVNAPGDVCLYHLGNNQLHRDIYETSLRRPGVLVLHDAVLHHFYLGALDREAYLREFAYNYGEWSRDLATEFWRARARSAQDARFFSYPMLRRAAERARAVVVHNPAAARIAAAHAPGTPVVTIPHLFSPPALPPAAEAIRWRQERGIRAGAFLFGVFGHLRESKRLPSVLRAFMTLREAGLDAALLVAGEFASSDLARSLAPRLAAPGVYRSGYAPEPEFWLMASAVDACINLRCPAAGETSGIAVRLMGIGKPVLLTAGEETAPFPEAACLKLDAGVAQEPMLAQYMMWLAVCPEAGREIGRRAAAHIARHHSIGEVARRYWEVLCAHSG